MRHAVPASLWHRAKPFVAWAFGGVEVRRTFTWYRLTHWTFVHIRFTPLAPSLAQLFVQARTVPDRQDAQVPQADGYARAAIPGDQSTNAAGA